MTWPEKSDNGLPVICAVRSIVLQEKWLLDTNLSRSKRAISGHYYCIEAISAKNLKVSLINPMNIAWVGTRQMRPPTRQSKPLRIGTERLSIACELST